MDKSVHRPKMHVLLVDDDPIFCKVMEAVAEQMGISILSCQQLEEIRALALPGVFDAAIVDYHLDGARFDLKGLAIAQQLRKTPTVLVSRSQRWELAPEVWPGSIKKFINKKEGAKEILNAAVEVKGRVH